MKKARKQAIENHGERTAYLKLIMWAISIFVTIFLALYIYHLTSFTGPMGEMKNEIKHLHDENTELKLENEKLQENLSEVKKSIIEMKVEIEHLRERNTQLENPAEKRLEKSH